MEGNRIVPMQGGPARAGGYGHSKIACRAGISFHHGCFLIMSSTTPIACPANASCSSPIAAKSPSASFARRPNLACAPSRFMRRKIAFAIHRFKADEAYVVGEGKGRSARISTFPASSRSRKKGVDFIHPATVFVRECRVRQGVQSRGGDHVCRPRVELLRMMGDKTAARALAKVGAHFAGH